MAESAVVLKKGETLFIQGDIPSELYLLQSGSLEILSAPRDYEGLDREIILSKSRRVGVIKAKTLIAGFSNNYTESNKKSLRAIEDSQVTRYPLPSAGFRGIVASDPSQTLTILRHLYNRLNVTISESGKYAKLYLSLSMMNDNLAIMYKDIGGTQAPADLEAQSEEVFKTFTEAGGSPLSKYTAQFLVADTGKLDKNYILPDWPIDLIFDKKSFNLIVKLLKLDPAIFVPAIKADPTIAISIFELMTDKLMKAYDLIDTGLDAIESVLTTLFGSENSWSSYLAEKGGFDDWKDSEKINDGFVKDLLQIIVKINTVYMEISGAKLTDTYPAINKIHKYFMSKKEEPKPEPIKTKAEAPAVIKGGAFKRSINQIFEFAVIDKEFQNRMLKLLNDFKNMRDPFDTESEGRKIRRQISKLYWDLYKQVFLRSKKEQNMPRPVRMMLLFGFLDDELMEESQMNELSEILAVRDKAREHPIYLEHEFLTKIYSGEEEPSITEMGQDYKAYLRELEKQSTSKKGAAPEPEVDENIKKTIFEIDQRLTSTAAVCSGSTATAFPILNSWAVKSSLKSLFVTRSQVEKIINELREIDFSVFYRETVLKLGDDAREIIMEEVVPNFIFLPVYGTKALLWQDLSGIDKRTKGRIVIPALFMGDLKRGIAHSFACFRWELNRSIKGGMWADPIEGGITGEYFDYVNTYKKNSKLSEEIKTKISIKFKSLRTYRDRFADDYLQWLFFEKDGIMKLNILVRQMFFKGIPFPREIRDKLEPMPVFSQDAYRFKNIYKKTMEGYMRKFKKYQDESGNYPPEIQKFLEFLNK